MPVQERSIRVEGVILRHSDLGEADRLLTIFTRETGKLRAIAKGVRKARSRKAGHVEPFTRASLQLARGRDLFILTQAEAVVVYANLREDLVLLSTASYVIELIDRSTTDEEENRDSKTENGSDRGDDHSRRLDPGSVSEGSFFIDIPSIPSFLLHGSHKEPSFRDSLVREEINDICVFPRPFRREILMVPSQKCPRRYLHIYTMETSSLFFKTKNICHFHRGEGLSFRFSRVILKKNRGFFLFR